MKMKLIKITSLALIAGYIIASSGCNKKIDEFGNINTNPSLAPELNTRGLIANAMSGMGDENWSAVPGLYSQLYAETQYTEASRYTRLQVDFGGYYSGVLYDLVNVIKYNTDPETAPKAALTNGSNANQIAVARILKAWWYLRVTDAWGDVPYFQALDFKGEIPYDSQEDIYKDLFKELKEAALQFDGGAPAKGDILLHGDIGAWIKFANSLRMIMAIRLSYVDANLGKSEFLDAMNSPGGYLTTNADDIMLAYPGGNYPSTFYEYYNVTQRFDYALSKTVTDHMNANGDLRVNAWGSSNVGFEYGLERDDAIAFASANPDWALIMSDAIRTETQPMPILTSSQVTLARAEAAQRGWTAEVAATLYRTGIELNWRQWDVYETVAFNAYMLEPAIVLTPGTELVKIITQRWLAAFPDGQEAWNIWRSTGIPVLTPAPGTGLEIPKRFAIAQTHFDLNNANTNAIATVYTVAGEKDSQYAVPWWVMP
jgi:hypothetical protein